MQLLNWSLIEQPMNWATVMLMTLIAFMALPLLFPVTMKEDVSQ